MVEAMKLWWEDGAMVFFALQYLTTPHKARKSYGFNVAGKKWRISYRDGMAHGGEICEQAWGLRSQIARSK